MGAWLWLLFTLATIASCAYALFGAALLRQFAQNRPILGSSRPGLTVLKPLCGAEFGLEANLISFCNQDHSGPVQLILGVESPADPALGAAKRLKQLFPDRDIELVVGSQRHGANRKISNLINMLARARHAIVVVSDSDIRVEPQYLQVVILALLAPNVGLVTCLYYGFSLTGLWSGLSAAAINEHFLPNALMGLKLGLARPCTGATIAARTETLRHIGGFEAFADHLADDYAIGEAVRELGLNVAVAPILVGHGCAETSLGELMRHELRWARTLRLLSPWGYVGLVLTHATPLALIAAALGGFGATSWATIALALACRLSIPIQLKSLSFGRDAWLWLSPIRDLLSFAIFLASFLPSTLSWRGSRYVLRSDGTLGQV
ncbi:MAG TPA: bacteriohopanetetrol glucosamine biosynthesis glycosyltransferase HpnI [Methyloceanibacter sp.]|nr:bacteriohopanetetrol glucosamine biosynthesis glycosyltransferase HpnI [Methyloceanibacter sp.]